MNNNSFKEFLIAMKAQAIYLNDFCSNIFTMREIGNKTHGDMAEIATVTFINQFLSDKYQAIHVGKALFRQKNREEDILVINKNTKEEIPISIKAYGEGPLQLSTDKEYTIYPLLESYNSNIIVDKDTIDNIMSAIDKQLNLNILLFIYNEAKSTCNIMIYDFNNIKNKITKIEKIAPQGRRKYPVYKFFNNDNYLFEVRYGGKMRMHFKGVFGRIHFMHQLIL